MEIEAKYVAEVFQVTGTHSGQCLIANVFLARIDANAFSIGMNAMIRDGYVTQKGNMFFLTEKGELAIFGSEKIVTVGSDDYNERELIILNVMKNRFPNMMANQLSLFLTNFSDKFRNMNSVQEAILSLLEKKCVAETAFGCRILDKGDNVISSFGNS